jgi:plasmid maintenance system antidote protein VapI
MRVSKVRLNPIINKKAPLTPEMALGLAKVTATDAGYRLRAEADYELDRARDRLGSDLDDLPVLAVVTVTS